MSVLSRVSLTASAINGAVGISRERLIAVARAVLSVAALAAIYVDPSQPAGGAAGYVALTVYLVFSAACLLAAVSRLENAQWTFGSHIVDIVLICAILYYTEGSTSPFFVYFTFILFAGTLRWEAPGALATGGLLSLALIVQSAIEIAGDVQAGELDRLIMRNVYLLVASALFAYVGGYLTRSRERLLLLASWPAAQPGAAELPSLAGSLKYAAEVVDACRVAIVWERCDEPMRCFALYDGQGCDYGQFEPGLEPAAWPAGRSGSWRGRAEVMPAGRLKTGARELDDRIARHRIDRDGVSVPFCNPLCSGRVYFLDMRTLTGDHFLLAEISAFRLGVELEHHGMQAQFELAAKSAERVQLARNLHDSILQSLTATTLRLHGAAAQAPPAQRKVLTELRLMLADEQRRTRMFIEDVRRLEPDAGGETPLRPKADELVRRLARLWNCRLDLRLDPLDAQAPRRLVPELEFIISESVANAVVHGGASDVTVDIKADNNRIGLTIANNGVGIDGLSGTYSMAQLASDEVGPASLRKRVAQLGGQLLLSTSANGIEIGIELPAGSGHP